MDTFTRPLFFLFFGLLGMYSSTQILALHSTTPPVSKETPTSSSEWNFMPPRLKGYRGHWHCQLSCPPPSAPPCLRAGCWSYRAGPTRTLTLIKGVQAIIWRVSRFHSPIFTRRKATAWVSSGTHRMTCDM